MRAARHAGAFVLFAAAAAAAGAAAERPAKIARIDGADVRVGDLVAGCASRACDVVVAAAPPPGVQRTYRRSEIERAVFAAGFDPAAIPIPATRTAVRPGERLEGTALRAQVEEAIRAALPPGVVLEELGAVSSVTVPCSGHEMTARASGEGRFRRKAVVPIEVSAEGAPFATIQASAVLALEIDLPVAARPIRAGELIGAADVRLERRRLTASPGDVALAAADVVGRSARRDLAAGSAFPRAGLEVVNVVRRGDRLSVAVEFGRVIVTAAAVAHGDGGVGERIQAELPATNRLVWIEVTARGRGTVVR